MYSLRTKIFFGFMVVVMGIGFPLSLLVGLPAFSGLFGGPVQDGSSETRKLLHDTRKEVRELGCGRDQLPSERLAQCKEALQDLGAAYQTLSQPEQATSDNPEPATPALADEYTRKAVETFEVLHRLDPDDEESVQALAGAYELQGSNELAEPLYASLSKRNPEDTDILFAWARAATAAGKTDVAISAYEKVLKLSPDDPNAEAIKEEIKRLKGEGSADAPVQ